MSNTNLKFILIPLLALVMILFVALETSSGPAAVTGSSLPVVTNTKKSTPDPKPKPIASSSGSSMVNLRVPFTPEAPDGVMVKPWNNSCEEASLVMLDEYYSGNREITISKASAKKQILDYIAIENKIFGYNANTNAKEMVLLINEYSKYFEAKVVTNPTLEQIKDELRAGRPVVALLHGFELNNPRILFARNGSYYHTFVIKGFDDNTGEFIVNDNGDLKEGLDLRYKYGIVLGALRDYSHELAKTVLPPTVLFTSAK